MEVGVPEFRRNRLALRSRCRRASNGPIPKRLAQSGGERRSILPGLHNLLRIKIIFFQNIYGKLHIYDSINQVNNKLNDLEHWGRARDAGVNAKSRRRQGAINPQMDGDKHRYLPQTTRNTQTTDISLSVCSVYSAVHPFSLRSHSFLLLSSRGFLGLCGLSHQAVRDPGKLRIMKSESVAQVLRCFEPVCGCLSVKRLSVKIPVLSVAKNDHPTASRPQSNLVKATRKLRVMNGTSFSICENLRKSLTANDVAGVAPVLHPMLHLN